MIPFPCNNSDILLSDHLKRNNGFCTANLAEAPNVLFNDVNGFHASLTVLDSVSCFMTNPKHNVHAP